MSVSDDELRVLCERALNETATTMADTLRSLGYPTVAEVVTIRIDEAKVIAQWCLDRIRTEGQATIHHFRCPNCSEPLGWRDADNAVGRTYASGEFNPLPASPVKANDA